jgi:acyl carrier protein
MPLEQIRDAVREAVHDLLKRRVNDTEPLVTSGLIDSLMILRLVADIEKRLGVRIETSAIQPEDFDTVEFGAETVERTITAE